MKTKFAIAGLVSLLLSGAALANDISIDAGVLPISPLKPYSHVFIHDANAFTDTIDFVVSAGSLGSSANPLNLKFAGSDVYNIAGLSYALWGGTSAQNAVFYGQFSGDNTTFDIDLNPGAYHVLVSGVANGSDGGVYALALVSGVPEPETLAMMLAGLGLVGVVVRRRNSAKPSA